MKNWYITATLSLMTFLPCFLGAVDADSPPPPPSSEQGLTQTLVMLAIFGAFFYLILWRPEQKRRKELETQRSSLKKGDRVIAMGIVGKVAKIQEETVILLMVDGAKIEVVKAAISEVDGEEDLDSNDK